MKTGISETAPDFVLYFSHQQAGTAADKPLQEVDNMRKGYGMNAHELQRFEMYVLKAERLEILELLRSVSSLEEAIKAIEQRKNG